MKKINSFLHIILCSILCFSAWNFTAINISAQNSSVYEWSQEELYQAEMAAAASGNASAENSTITSSSYVNWNTQTFSSKVTLDTIKAGIPMPSGKASSINRIQMQLPVLIKDPLLSIYVDNANTLGDLVLEGAITLEELTRIIDNAKQTPAVFSQGTSNLLTEHSILLRDINAILVKHKTPYTQQLPIELKATRSYTGIVIDARGVKDVHGEFVKSKVSPCLFPRIWNENMDLVYERHMVNPTVAKDQMIVLYSSETNASKLSSRVGDDPLWITSRKVYGQNRTDPIISMDDYLRITSNESNLELLRQGKVVILLDESEISHNVSAPEKNRNYYLEYQRIRRFFYENVVPDTVVLDSQPGMEINVDNLRFIADSAELLPEEMPRIKTIAQSLKRFTDTGSFTILVEGHTADVNKPNGQLQLSIERAQTIINILVAEGLDRTLFTYKGYGGTEPVASNDTPEGRAQNRRVKITVMPKSSSVQRAP